MANRIDAADEERPAGPEHNWGRQRELEPRHRGGRHRHPSMASHRDHHTANAQGERPPESEREALELRIALFLDGRHLGFERHAANGTVTWGRLANLWMHRAGVDRDRAITHRRGRAG